MNNVCILISIILILIEITCFYWGFKSGLMKMVFNFLNTFISFIFAKMLQPIIANFIFNQFVAQKLIYEITKTSTKNIQEIYMSVPFFIKPFLDKNTIKQALINANGNNVNNIVFNIIKPIFVFATSGVIMFLGFLISLLIFNMIFKIINKFCKLPLIKTTNKIFGGIIGLIIGLFLCVFVLFIINLYFYDNPSILKIYNIIPYLKTLFNFI